jgi:hypothetical protein
VLTALKRKTEEGGGQEAVDAVDVDVDEQREKQRPAMMRRGGRVERDSGEGTKGAHGGVS